MPANSTLLPSTSAHWERQRLSLTHTRRRTAFSMVLNGQAEAVQTGAFLMLLRVKEKRKKNSQDLSMQYANTSVLLPIFTSILTGLPTPANESTLPWFILSALLLAKWYTCIYAWRRRPYGWPNIHGTVLPGIGITYCNHTGNKSAIRG